MQNSVSNKMYNTFIMFIAQNSTYLTTMAYQLQSLNQKLNTSFNHLPCHYSPSLSITTPAKVAYFSKIYHPKKFPMCALSGPTSKVQQVNIANGWEKVHSCGGIKPPTQVKMVKVAGI
jgi:hypothetical protein